VGFLSDNGREESLLARIDLDPQSAAFAFEHLDGVAAAGPHLIENGLARDAELAGGLVKLDLPIGHGRHEPLPNLVGQPDSPRRVFRGLLGREQPLRQPPADRHRADSQLAGGLVD
jgi:hypothetical protein